MSDAPIGIQTKYLGSRFTTKPAPAFEYCENDTSWRLCLVTPESYDEIRPLTPYEKHWYERGYTVESVIDSYLEWYNAPAPSEEDDG